MKRYDSIPAKFINRIKPLSAWIENFFVLLGKIQNIPAFAAGANQFRAGLEMVSSAPLMLCRIA
jgi:hypothetical protein